MGLDIQIGALGAANEHFKKKTGIFCLFFYGLQPQRKSVCGCTDLNRESQWQYSELHGATLVPPVRQTCGGSAADLMLARSRHSETAAFDQ